MLAFGLLLPQAAKVLSAASLAADFGPRNPRARQVIRQCGAANGAASYYSLILDCLGARLTGESVATPLQELGEPLLRRLCEYKLPQEPVDLLKDLYLELFPRTTRHRLGEYYTPDWLAERLLAETLGANLGDPSVRILDPACGSGTFLVLLIKHIRRRVELGHFAPREARELIVRNVAGFDVHPLAARTARVNYLLALGSFVRHADIPVYETDAILGGPDLPAFDYVVGNPPWVNWQNLAEAYRRKSMPLWEYYGLFPKRQTAMQTILGAAKYDLSMLMIYAAADRYLRAGGQLGFIVSQALFKTAAAGQGFRRFELPDGTPLGVRLVEDLVKLRPFDSAANRTATLLLEKGRLTEYPVEYRYHRDGQESRWSAQPISTDPSSPWITAPSKTLGAITRILGASEYRVREGTNTGGANGVFWIEVTTRRGRRVGVRNVIEGARKQVPAVRATVESELVYPLLRGQNVARWQAVPEHSILITHRPGMKLRAVAEPEMQKVFPGAFSYLKRFADLLRQRPAYRRYFKQDAPFYSMFNVGDYTFAPWKVVWREQALPFTAAVVGPMDGKVVIPDHKLMAVAVDSEDEAHYLCGALNSLPVNATVGAYAIETQIDTHVLQHIRVPRFDRRDGTHRRLAAASRAAHTAVRNQSPARLRNAESAVGRWAARLWGLGEPELEDLREFLREIGLGLNRRGSDKMNPTVSL